MLGLSILWREYEATNFCLSVVTSVFRY